MDQLYVKADSKKTLNEKLARGELITGTVHRLGRVSQRLLTAVPDCTVVKLYVACDGVGNPIARRYGTWNARKQRVD